jgi:hypothetical protein
VLLVVGESGPQVGGWSWWALVLSDGCATPGVRLPGLVSVYGRCCWSLEPDSAGRWSRCFFLFAGGGLWWLVLVERLLLFTLGGLSSCSSSSD